MAHVVRVYKGCSVTPSNPVLVRTGRDGGLCGVIFNENESYLFSGFSRQQIGTNSSRTCPEVRVGMCYVNVPLTRISTETLQALNQLNTSQCCQNCSTTNTNCLIDVPIPTPTRAPMSVRTPSKAPVEKAEVPTMSRPTRAPMSVRVPSKSPHVVQPVEVPTAAETRAPVSVRVPTRAPVSVDAPLDQAPVTTAPKAAPKAAPMRGPTNAPIAACGLFGWRRFCLWPCCRIVGRLFPFCHGKP
jgi:hypothetical protein